MKKRICSILLIAVLLLGIFAGCGNGTEELKSPDGKPSQQNPSATDGLLQTKYVYQPEYLSLDVGDGVELGHISAFCVSDSYFYFAANCITKTGEPLLDEATGEPIMNPETGEPYEASISEMALFVLNLETKATTKLDGYKVPELPEGVLGDSYINSMSAGADGTVWLQEQTSTYSFDLPEDFDPETQNSYDYYVPGENKVSLRQFNASGEELKSVPMQMEENQYVQRMMMDSKGNIYAYMDSPEQDGMMVAIFDSNGTLLGSVPDENYGELCAISADEIGIISYGPEGRVLKLIDPVTKAYGEEVKLVDNANRVYPGIENYRYLYDSYGSSVFGYNAETGEGEKLFSWLDCDVNSNNLDQFSILDDGRVVALERNWRSSDSREQMKLVVLNPVDASTLPQKEELTLACMWLDYDMQAKVIEFNRTHQDVRIVVKDYSEFDSEENRQAGITGLTKLNTEILSGQVPDILSTNGLPLDQYASKGILIDLWPMIDNDEELSREDLMTHLFDVMSIDGKLYQVAKEFAIYSVVGNKKVVGDRTAWTLDEMLEALDTLPEGATIFGEHDIKSSILSNCINSSADGFIDWEAGQCSFDSPEFIDLLNFANSYPAEFDWESYDYETAESEYSRFQTGKQLLTQAYISDFSYMQYLGALVGGDPSFVGYPTTEGSGNCFMVDNGLAISSACKYPDLAWSFVRTVLEEDTEESNMSYHFSFPANRKNFEKVVEDAMTPQYELDWETGEPVIDPETGEKVEISNHSWSVGNDLTIDIYAMKQNEYDAFMKLYESCDSVYTNNDEVAKIINEETEAFFAGQKTAEETANLIQNRVSLYVAEQS